MKYRQVFVLKIVLRAQDPTSHNGKKDRENGVNQYGRHIQNNMLLISRKDNATLGKTKEAQVESQRTQCQKGRRKRVSFPTNAIHMLRIAGLSPPEQMPTRTPIFRSSGTFTHSFPLILISRPR
jgi:hypothetical protein